MGVQFSLCWEGGTMSSPLSAGALTFCLHGDGWVWLDGWPCSKLPKLRVSSGWIPVTKPDSTTQTCSPAQRYVNEGAGENPTYILFAHSRDKHIG